MHMHMYVYLREYIACASSSKCLCVPVNYLASACVGGWVGGDECANINNSWARDQIEGKK